MHKCDVLIVGGGPAGSSVAWGLRSSGLDVVVLDRKGFPRDKTCAGWVTPQVFEELAIDPETYAKENVLQPITGFRVRRIGNPDVEVGSTRPISFGIRRCELDHYLLRRCEARLRLAEPLAEFERVGSRWHVNGELDAGLIVGAGGHFCPVARRISETHPEHEPIVAAQEVEWLLDRADRESCPVRAEVPELFFCEDLRGYGWIFRKGDYLNVGLGRQDRRGLSDHVERFLGFLNDAGRLPSGAPRGLHGHAYLLYGQAPRPLLDDGVLLVGDAAGLAYPRSGEGIRPAVESGLLAARVIEAARGCYTRQALAPYRSALERRLGTRHPRVRLGATDLLPAPLAQRLAGRLLSNPWFARRYVVDRWFLHADQPALQPSA